MLILYRYILLMIVTIILTLNVFTQRAVERPSQINRDLQEINLILEEVTVEERRFKQKLTEYNDDLRALRDEVDRLPARSRKRILAAEQFEKIFSEALAEQYEFLNKIKEARDRTVYLLERVIDSTPVDNTAIEHITKAITEIDNTILDARIEIERTAVLIIFSSASPEEQEDLAREMVDIEQNKLALYENHRGFLEEYKSRVSSIGGNIENYRSNLRRMLGAIQSRSRIVDVAIDRIRTVALVQKELAVSRHNMVELDKSIAVLHDMLRQAHMVDREMNEFWSSFLPDFILGEVSVMPDFDNFETLDYEFGGTSNSRREHIDPRREAQRVLDRKQ